MIESNNLSRTRFEQLYKRESDADVKERMLLVLNVVYDKHIPAAQVARDLHRSRTWASDWLKSTERRRNRRIKNQIKKWQTTREIPQEIVYKIKSQLLSSKQGWTTKQVNDIIIRESGVRYHQIYIYTLLRKWGFKQKVPRKVHVNTATREEKERFKKEQERYYWIISSSRKDSR